MKPEDRKLNQDKQNSKANKKNKRTGKKKKSGSKALDLAYKIIIAALIGIILVSGYKVATGLWQYHTARQGYKEVQKTASVDPDQVTGVVDFDALHKIDPNIKGWLYSKDTIINYPVAKGSDNDYYLHHDIKGNWTVTGTLFIDVANQDNFGDFNTVIYGHHMKDGSMFGSLRKYKDQSYYDQHSQLEYITPEGKYHLQVISFYTTPAVSDTYKVAFNSDQEKQDFLNMTVSKSEIKPKYSADIKDHLVTLSTCAYEYDEARYVAVCKAVPWTKGEIKKGEAAEKQR